MTGLPMAKQTLVLIPTIHRRLAQLRLTISTIHRRLAHNELKESLQGGRYILEKICIKNRISSVSNLIRGVRSDKELSYYVCRGEV